MAQTYLTKKRLRIDVVPAVSQGEKGNEMNINLVGLFSIVLLMPVLAHSADRSVPLPVLQCLHGHHQPSMSGGWQMG